MSWDKSTRYRAHIASAGRLACSFGCVVMELLSLSLSTVVCLAGTTNGTAAAMQWRPAWGMSCYSPSEEVMDVKAAAAWWTSNNRDELETSGHFPSPAARHSGATEGPPGSGSTRGSDCMPELGLSSENITDKGGAIGSPPSAPQPLDRVRGEVTAAWAQSQHTSGHNLSPTLWALGAMHRPHQLDTRARRQHTHERFDVGAAAATTTLSAPSATLEAYVKGYAGAAHQLQAELMDLPVSMQPPPCVTTVTEEDNHLG